MVDLTPEERRYALTLLSHNLIVKLFDDLEATRLNEAVTAKSTETDRINAALGEVRAVRNLRRTLEILASEERNKAAG